MRINAQFVVLLALLLAFYLTGGFHSPDVHSLFRRERGRILVTWLVTLVLYIAGAITAVYGHRSTGNLAPVSLRPLYIIAGIIAMIAAWVWGYTIRTTFP